MGRKITFTNSRGGSITFGNSGTLICFKIEGTGSPEATIQLSRAPFQDGGEDIDSILESRQIIMECGLFASNREEIMKLRSRVSSVLNPKLGKMKLKYEYDGGAKEIFAKSELAPVFPGGKDNTSPTFQRVFITLLCPNPFWLDEFEQSEVIATWIGGIKFSLRLPTRFATKGPKRKLIVNKGDVETPVEIVFSGPATNPKISNLSTGKFIQVKRELQQGDKLIINTEFGKKRVEIVDNLGNRTNVFNWIDLKPGFAFWQLQVGDNIIEYSSDNDIEPASVAINYRNRYIGV